MVARLLVLEELLAESPIPLQYGVPLLQVLLDLRLELGYIRLILFPVARRNANVHRLVKADLFVLTVGVWQEVRVPPLVFARL